MGLWHICMVYVHKYPIYSTWNYALVVSLACSCGHDEVYVWWGISAMGMSLNLNKKISYIIGKGMAIIVDTQFGKELRFEYVKDT